MPTYDVTVTETCVRTMRVLARDRRQAARVWKRQHDLHAVEADCDTHVDVDLDDPVCDDSEYEHEV